MIVSPTDASFTLQGVSIVPDAVCTDAVISAKATELDMRVAHTDSSTSVLLFSYVMLQTPAACVNADGDDIATTYEVTFADGFVSAGHYYETVAASWNEGCTDSGVASAACSMPAVTVALGSVTTSDTTSPDASAINFATLPMVGFDPTRSYTDISGDMINFMASEAVEPHYGKFLLRGRATDAATSGLTATPVDVFFSDANAKHIFSVSTQDPAGSTLNSGSYQITSQTGAFQDHYGNGFCAADSIVIDFIRVSSMTTTLDGGLLLNHDDSTSESPSTCSSSWKDQEVSYSDLFKIKWSDVQTRNLAAAGIDTAVAVTAIYNDLGDTTEVTHTIQAPGSNSQVARFDGLGSGNHDTVAAKGTTSTFSLYGAPSNTPTGNPGAREFKSVTIGPDFVNAFPGTQIDINFNVDTLGASVARSTVPWCQWSNSVPAAPVPCSSASCEVSFELCFNKVHKAGTACTTADTHPGINPR